MNKHKVIAIDGPGGSGKSTVAQMLASRLGFLYVNTGAMYRALTLKVLRKKVPVDDPDAIESLTHETDVTIKRKENGGTDVFLDGVNVTNRVREPDVANAVSPVSRIPAVRHWLVEKQRNASEVITLCVKAGISVQLFFRMPIINSFSRRLSRSGHEEGW